MEETLQHKETTQRPALSPADSGNNRPEGPEVGRALTIKPDHSGGADHFKMLSWPRRCCTWHGWQRSAGSGLCKVLVACQGVGRDRSTPDIYPQACRCNVASQRRPLDRLATKAAREFTLHNTQTTLKVFEVSCAMGQRSYSGNAFSSESRAVRGIHHLWLRLPFRLTLSEPQRVIEPRTYVLRM